jgi:outer membrane murein-binding lipoprotein Lpp
MSRSIPISNKGVEMSKAMKYNEDLQQVGFTQEQALVVVTTMENYVEETFVTKTDLDIAVLKIDHKIEHFVSELNSKIDQVENRLSTKIDQVENRLNAKIDQVEVKLNKRIDTLESKMENLHDKIVIKLGAMMMLGFSALGVGIGIVIYMK